MDNATVTTREEGAERAWRRTAVTWVVTFVTPLILFVLLVIAIDPYDSGRFPTFMPSGSPDERPPTIGISRGRDPRFNAIMLGSSRAVLADARRMSELTGYRFVQMAAEGTTARDQMILLRWFARHRPRVEAIMVAADQVWCDRDPAVPDSADFPAGLYADSDFAYLKAALSLGTAVFGRDRIRYALGRIPAVDPTGVIDIETKYSWLWVPLPPWIRVPAGGTPAKAKLPALDLFDSYLQQIPDHPPIVLWMPPLHRDDLPPPDSTAGRDLAGCKAALQEWAQRRGRAAFVDFAVDTPEAADRDNFLEWSHIRRRYMQLLEPQIAAALNRLK